MRSFLVTLTMFTLGTAIGTGVEVALYDIDPWTAFSHCFWLGVALYSGVAALRREIRREAGKMLDELGLTEPDDDDTDPSVDPDDDVPEPDNDDVTAHPHA